MTRRRDLPITAILMLGVGGIVLTALASIYLLGLVVAVRNTTDLTTLRAERSLDGLTRAIRLHVAPAEAHARHAAGLVAGLDGDPGPDAIDRLHSTMALIPHLRHAGFLGADGTYLRYGRSGQYELSTWTGDEGITRLFATMAPDTDALWLDPVYLSSIRRTVIPVVVPVSRNGQLVGMTAAGVTLRELSRFVFDLAPEASGTAFILRGTTQVIAHPKLLGIPIENHTGPDRPLPDLAVLDDPILQAFADGESRAPWVIGAGQRANARFITSERGEDHILLWEELADYDSVPWMVGFHAPAGALEGANVWTRLVGAAAVGLVLVALALAALFLLGRYIRRPVRELARLSLQVRDLDFSSAPTARASLVRELNEAGDAFTRMLDGLTLFATFVPRALVLRLMRSGTGVDLSEQRAVTVMFTDIAGFTGMSERLSAGEVAGVLNHHFALLNHGVEHEGGTVDKYIGDSMMAFWGAPEDQEDHAARGCRAVRAIAEAVRADNLERRERGDEPLRLRIGVHTGPVIAGTIGAPGRVNYTLVGDTVNVANRIEQLGKDVAPEDDVVVLASGETIAAAGLDVPEVGAFDIRGRAGQITVFRLA